MPFEFSIVSGAIVRAGITYLACGVPAPHTWLTRRCIRETIYGSSIRASAERAAEARKMADQARLEPAHARLQGTGPALACSGRRAESRPYRPSRARNRSALGRLTQLSVRRDLEADHDDPANILVV
jgi:hypothetical protein